MYKMYYKVFAYYMFIKMQTKSEVESPKLTTKSSVEQTISSFTWIGAQKKKIYGSLSRESIAFTVCR